MRLYRPGGISIARAHWEAARSVKPYGDSPVLPAPCTPGQGRQHCQAFDTFQVPPGDMEPGCSGLGGFVVAGIKASELFPVASSCGMRRLVSIFPCEAQGPIQGP